MTWLEKKRVPRWASSLTAILLMVGGVFVLILFAMPVIVQQFNDILKAIGNIVQDFADLLRSGRIFTFLARYGLPVEGARDVISQNISPRLESVLTGLFGGVFGFLTGVSDIVLQLVNAVIVPVLLFYILMDYPHILDRGAALVPVHRREAALAFGRRVDNLMGRYFRGIITVAIIQGAISSIGLTLLGVRYSIALGVITGLLTLIPFFGIIVSLVVSDHRCGDQRTPGALQGPGCHRAVSFAEPARYNDTLTEDRGPAGRSSSRCTSACPAGVRILPRFHRVAHCRSDDVTSRCHLERVAREQAVEAGAADVKQRSVDIQERVKI